MRNGIRISVAMVAVAAMTGQVFADLPGLPAPALPREDVRTSAQAMPVQTGPVRTSLFRQGAVSANMAPVGMQAAPAVSFIAVAPLQPKRYQKNDVVTIVIREQSNATTDNKGDSKKTQDFDFGIEQFLELALASSGFPVVGTTANPGDLPAIKFRYSDDRQADASRERKDNFSARLSATVVDVKPNGTMVVEAVKHIMVDKEEQIFTLTGICRVEDIAVDNTVLSTQLANLSLSKQTKGEVRDATKRGWLNKFIDVITPF